MVQQMAIYDQGCKLMVSALPIYFRINGIILLDRMQVRIPFGPEDECLT